MHVALRLAYDGHFSGFARQPQGGTVEDHVLAALAPEGLVEGSWRAGSRTDRGVAAAGNVAACQLERPHLRGIVPAVQARLPQGLWVTGAAPAEPGFDPRRAAWREYTYTAPAGGEDLEAMQAACRGFVGTHDVRAFARLEPGRRAARTVLSCTVTLADGWLLRVRGHSFLWNQVRRMADAVLQVGRGRAAPEDIAASLAAGRPHPCFGLAPAHGLLLETVVYDPEPPWQTGPPPRSLDRAAQRAAVEGRLARLARAALG